MPFAAAAVVGSARGAGRARNFQHVSNLESPVNGPSVVAGLATCACIALNIAGVTMLVKSMTDTRGALVADYDHQVEMWEGANRAGFTSLNISIKASWEGKNVTLEMAPEETKEPHFTDAERGKGLLMYHPLTYAATFDFGSYYPGSQPREARDWERLPQREAARKVTFELHLKSNASSHTFALPALPIVWDETVHARTPAPDDKCVRERHGVWRERNCHVVKRLEHLCLQVRPFEKDWRPFSKPPGEGEELKGHYRDNEITNETYGCHPRNNWHPAFFEIDPCWGKPVSERCPKEQRENYTVTLRVRSSFDPFIHAEEITHNTLNFGYSQTSQRVNGCALLFVGLCACIVPMARLIFWRRRVWQEDSKFQRQRDVDVGPPGIYGNSVM